MVPQQEEVNMTIKMDMKQKNSSCQNSNLDSDLQKKKKLAHKCSQTPIFKWIELYFTMRWQNKKKEKFVLIYILAFSPQQFFLYS